MKAEKEQQQHIKMCADIIERQGKICKVNWSSTGKIIYDDAQREYLELCVCVYLCLTVAMVTEMRSTCT